MSLPLSGPAAFFVFCSTTVFFVDLVICCDMLIVFDHMLERGGRAGRAGAGGARVEGDHPQMAKRKASTKIEMAIT